MEYADNTTKMAERVDRNGRLAILVGAGNGAGNSKHFYTLHFLIDVIAPQMGVMYHDA